MTGRFVALEGGEGSGKSTQADRLAAAMGAVLTREPGGTAVGARIRDLVLHADIVDLADRTEALLMAADRAQHVAQVVQPALDAGRDVVTDRFLGSSLAYQGFGRGLPVEEIHRLSLWATDGLQPDVVVLLDVSDEVARRRIGDGDRRWDRVEAAGDSFHRNVLAGFRALAAAGPQRWVVVDGDGSVDDVAGRVHAAVADRLRR